MHFCVFDKTQHEEPEADCPYAQRHKDYNWGFSQGQMEPELTAEEKAYQAWVATLNFKNPRDFLSFTIGRPVTDDEWVAFCCFDKPDRTEEQQQALDRFRQGVQNAPR